jgi:hypothetical protein
MVSARASVRHPSETYVTLLIVPPQSDISRSPAGSELKLAVGCPNMGDAQGEVELGAGMANVLSGAGQPAMNPSVGQIVSAVVCPTNVCGSSRS